LERGFATEDDLARTEENGRFADADPSKVSPQAKGRGLNQLGTLGAGNHFLEVQAVDSILDEETAKAFGINKVGQVVLMIHCGSRGLGHQVCTDYLRRIEKEHPDLMAALPEKNLAYAPLSSAVGRDYYKAMCAAANFAFANRQMIAHRSRAAFERLFPGCELRQVYDVAHNIAKREVHVVDGVEREVYVHRKGATRAFPPGHPQLPEALRAAGQPVLIPGSMGTASYVLVGTQKAMEQAFGSSAHGAGRLMSRTHAKREFRGEQVVGELRRRGIIVKAASHKGVAEEAPLVYKDVDEVIRVTRDAGIARPVARLIPLGVVKG
jgi:tRNA-splicing ligase RtcB (3'-phosphate/5'-hydroxy nucleic acid ligase)